MVSVSESSRTSSSASPRMRCKCGIRAQTQPLTKPGRLCRLRRKCVDGPAQCCGQLLDDLNFCGLHPLSARWRYTTPKTCTVGLQDSSTVSYLNDSVLEQWNARCQAAITVLYSHHQTAIWKGVSTMRLEGKVALISGGARGQGATEARLFAREGAKVVLGEIRDEAGKQVEAEIRAAGGEATKLHLEVTSDPARAEAVGPGTTRSGRVAIL